MEEENTELSLKLQCAEETVWFVNPYPRLGGPYSFTALCGAETTTAYQSGRDIVSTSCHGERLQLDISSGRLIPPSCGFVKGELSDMDAVSCGGTIDESEDIIRQWKPRKKLRLSQNQLSLLEESFREHSRLSQKHKSALASNLDLQPRQVEVWFQNRRARTKLKRKEVERESLKQCCERLREENIRLEREVQALRAMKIVQGGGEKDLYAQSPNSTPLAAATLTRCPYCECLATKDRTATTFTSQVKTIPSR